MIRVVGGKYKRRQLEQPSLEISRPTKDMVKEGLFNILKDISNSIFLDMFSGSGSIAIEASSRDAKIVYAIEINKDAIKVIKNNISKIGIDNILLFQNDYKNELINFKNKKIKFDYIFVDPPYKFNIDETFILYIENLNILNEKGIIILETETELKNIDEKQYIYKFYKYGRTYLNIYKRK